MAAGGLATTLGAGAAHADAGIGLHKVSNAQGADVHQGDFGLYLGHLAKDDKFDTTSHDSRGGAQRHANGNAPPGRFRPAQDLTPTNS